jgi:hypothetical protein
MKEGRLHKMTVESKANEEKAVDGWSDDRVEMRGKIWALRCCNSLGGCKKGWTLLFLHTDPTRGYVIRGNRKRIWRIALSKVQTCLFCATIPYFWITLEKNLTWSHVDVQSDYKHFTGSGEDADLGRRWRRMD